MIFGGLTKFSLKDYPGKLSCILYTIGCNFRCPFCHNGSLVNKTVEHFPEEDILEFLHFRKNQMNGVVMTGGEPTIHPGLKEICSTIKEMGYSIKLDTNGYLPDVIGDLINDGLIDCIAMDVKTSLGEKYEDSAGVTIDVGRIERSIDIIKNSNIEKIFRTTVVPGLVTEKDIEEIRDRVSPEQYVLNEFIPTHVLDREKIRTLHETHLRNSSDTE